MTDKDKNKDKNKDKEPMDEGDFPEELELSNKMVRHIIMTFLLDKDWSSLDDLMMWGERICSFIIGVAQREITDDVEKQFKEMMEG